jgi:hypothetical protein
MTINTSLTSNCTRVATDTSGIQDRVTVGSFSNDRITGNNDTETRVGLLGANTIRRDGDDDKVKGKEDLDSYMGNIASTYFKRAQPQISCRGEVGKIYF